MSRFLYYEILIVTIRAVESALREEWYTPFLYGCRIQLFLNAINLYSSLAPFGNGYNQHGITAIRQLQDARSSSTTGGNN